MHHYDGSLVTSGDVYITIIRITDIINPVIVVSTTLTDVYHVGSGVWGYNNPFEDPGDEVYLVIFEFTESPPNWTSDYTHTVTGAIGSFSEESGGDWSIVAAGGTTIGEIRKPSSRRVEIQLNNGRKLNLRKR